ncbi:hypothetical protein FJU08_01245 [Martelella alba]|uniref:Uncharacterized protein n=1 Tax=Martelella alba TaxID=2590451 RepID=A0A506UIS0_9HYPH|nr:XRE family transcriptional regulator [Martelella alba]TPW33219.1 hypothetical protein FJU08_01245 [Martelella alba]
MTALALPQNKLARMIDNQRDTKVWLKAVADHMNLSLSKLALNSGMAASTLTRYFNDRTGSVGITQSTLENVARYSGFRPGQMPGRNLNNLAEPDALPFDNDNEPQPEWISLAVKAARSSRNGVEAWIMKGAALDGIGVMPGDVVIIDQNRRAKSGDIVIAQIVDPVRGIAETVMRLYQAPFITTHSMRLGPQRPEQVDDDRVSIAGTAIGVIRKPS